MTLVVRRALGALAAAALVLGGCTSEEGDDPHASHESSAAAGEPGEPGEVDIGFAQDMAVHHEQALRMAELAQTRSTAAVAALAGPMLVSQARETGVLRGWLQLWGAPQLPSGEPMTWMHDHDHGGRGGRPSETTGGRGGRPSDRHETMPGMATTAQMQRLESLAGRPFDLLFLQLMTRHHRGGLPMAAYAVEHASLSPVADVARQMIADQSLEISQMVTLRRSLSH